MFFSLLLYLILNPFVNTMERYLKYRSIAAGIVLVVSICLVSGGITLLSKSFVPTFRNLIIDIPSMTEQFNRLPFINEFSFLSTELDNLWGDILNAGISALKSSLGVVLSVFNKFIDLVVIIFVTFYLLADGENIKKFLLSCFPANGQLRIKNLLDKIFKILHGYITSQLLICCITALIVFTYYKVRDLPYASVFAVASGIAEFIPVLGPTVASAFGVVLTIIHSPIVALQTAGFYLILTQVNHNVIYPNLIGKTLKLHPIAIILGIILGGELMNAIGMFLAVPMIAICKIIMEDIHDNYEQMNSNSVHNDESG